MRVHVRTHGIFSVSCSHERSHEFFFAARCDNRNEEEPALPVRHRCGPSCTHAGWRVRRAAAGHLQRVALRASQDLSVEPLRRDSESVASFAFPVADGEYAEIPAWGSRARWLAAKDAALDGVEGRELRAAWTPRKKWVRRAVIDKVALAIADAADHQTGRNVKVSRRTIALRTGLLRSDIDESMPNGHRLVAAAVKQVGRVLEILSHLGLHHVLLIGRLLSSRERTWISANYGISQTAAASVRALSVPQRFATVAGVHLPKSLDVKTNSHLRKSNKRRIPRTQTVDKSSRQKPPKPETPRSLQRTPGFQRFVAQLDVALVQPDGRVVGRFTQGHSTRSLMKILDEFGITEEWSAPDFLERILRWKPGYTLSNGLGWLRSRLVRHFGNPGEIADMPEEFKTDPTLRQAWRTDPELRRSWGRYQAIRHASPGSDRPSTVEEIGLKRRPSAVAVEAVCVDADDQAWREFVEALDPVVLEHERFSLTAADGSGRCG